MNTLVPNRFLFGLEFPLRYRKEMPAIDGQLAGWTDAELLPALGELDGIDDFAKVWACWSESGIAIAAQVSKKLKPLRCDPKKFWAGDNLRLCVDMRDARSVKRATRFCQQFFFLPAGGGKRGVEPVAGVNKFKRAREDAPSIAVDRIAVASKVTKSGYSISAHVPAECLSGFAPEEHSRIGFYYILEDGDHGQQYLTVGDDLNWYVDPSTWATAVLERHPGDKKSPRGR